MKHNTKVFLLAFFCAIGIWGTAQKVFPQDEELGNVHWYRDYNQALDIAQKEGKDVLILFQEVPGCATCRNYGQNVLSHPLMVEAIEELFVPLAIFNNKGGKDREILNKYNEPTWNNPVVRIVDHKGRNVIDRISGNYSQGALYTGMVKALELYGKSVPQYFELYGQEISAQKRNKETCFEMYCFWSGEKQLGSVEGILNTESGFMNRAEVVKVTYDPEKVDTGTLERFAKSNSMRPVTLNDTYRKSDKDLHYYLRHTNYMYLPLTPLQQTKINSALGHGKSGVEFLSPQQKKWLTILENKTYVGNKSNLINTEFTKAWEVMDRKGSS